MGTRPRRWERGSVNRCSGGCGSRTCPGSTSPRRKRRGRWLTGAAQRARGGPSTEVRELKTFSPSCECIWGGGPCHETIALGCTHFGFLTTFMRGCTYFARSFSTQAGTFTLGCTYSFSGGSPGDAHLVFPGTFTTDCTRIWGCTFFASRRGWPRSSSSGRPQLGVEDPSSWRHWPGPDPYAEMERFRRQDAARAAAIWRVAAQEAAALLPEPAEAIVLKFLGLPGRWR